MGALGAQTTKRIWKSCEQWPAVRNFGRNLERADGRTRLSMIPHSFDDWSSGRTSPRTWKCNNILIFSNLFVAFLMLVICALYQNTSWNYFGNGILTHFLLSGTLFFPWLYIALNISNWENWQENWLFGKHQLYFSRCITRAFDGSIGSSHSCKPIFTSRAIEPSKAPVIQREKYNWYFLKSQFSCQFFQLEMFKSI